MAGFLDKNDRIIDFVITGKGKSLLSKGNLRFVYWRAFDDEIDYNPFISQSGSLTAAQIEDHIQEQIEFTPIREATTGYKDVNSLHLDNTNVFLPLYDMPQGQSQIPRTVFDAPDDPGIEIVQQKITNVLVKRDQNGNVIDQLGPFDWGFKRFDSSKQTFTMAYSGFPSDFKPEGFLVRVLESGSDGYVEIMPQRDQQNRLSFGPDFSLVE